MLEIMLLPLLACLVLSVMHAYLGSHIIQRGVIFVDLALAQVAALGATCGYLFGFELHSPGSYYISLGFALIGAMILALSRGAARKVPHEAIIGIVYALAAAASIIVLSKAPQGGEELKALLVGHLLFVTKGELLYVSAVYGAVGLALAVMHPKLVLISEDAARASDRGVRVWLYDFIFYALFALVVTSSVELAGVLLVFALLVAPSVCAALLAETVRYRLLIGWGIGVLTCILGLSLSFTMDLPSGASVVCTFILPLLVCSGIAAVRFRMQQIGN